jgi:hypothetical protein
MRAIAAVTDIEEIEQQAVAYTRPLSSSTEAILATPPRSPV